MGGGEVSDILGDFLKDTFRVTGETVRKTDAVMAKTGAGICLGENCIRLCDGEDGLCTDHRKED